MPKRGHFAGLYLLEVLQIHKIYETELKVLEKPLQHTISRAAGGRRISERQEGREKIIAEWNQRSLITWHPFS